jgi:hypothetical protein
METHAGIGLFAFLGALGIFLDRKRWHFSL